MIPLNEKYFNLFEYESFFISEGPLKSSFTGKPFYTVSWEDGIVSNWYEDELIEWLNDASLNIKIDDDKHLLVLKLKYSDLLSP